MQWSDAGALFLSRYRDLARGWLGLKILVSLVRFRPWAPDSTTFFARSQFWKRDSVPKQCAAVRRFPLNPLKSKADTRIAGTQVGLGHCGLILK